MIIAGIFIGIVLVAQIFITVVAYKKEEKQYLLQLIFSTFLLLMVLLFGVAQLISFDLRILPFGLVLILQVIWNLFHLKRKRHCHLYKRNKFLFASFFRTLGLLVLILPFFIFPYYKLIPPTGPMKVATKTYTWNNDAAHQPFIRTNKGSKVITAQFWYPDEKLDTKNAAQKYPLVVFCHGFSMLRDSNLSLFQELASHGYIVCSVDLDYETLWSVRQNHTIALQRLDELLDLNAAKSDDASFLVCKKWNRIRANDLNNVIDYVALKASSTKANGIWNQIDHTKIALVGHSFGGSAAAEAGAENKKIGAVVDMDGTVYHTMKSITKKTIVTDTTPYETPILMMFSEPHVKIFAEYKKVYKDTYPNVALLENATEGYSAKIKGADHFSFSDMHINAPIAAIVSGGSETRNSKDAIRTINGCIENFLNKYLKNESVAIQSDATY